MAMTEASHKLFPGMKFDDSSAKCRRRRRRRRRYGETRKVGMVGNLVEKSRVL